MQAGPSRTHKTQHLELSAGTRPHVCRFESDLVGELLLVSDGNSLIGCYFEDTFELPRGLHVRLETTAHCNPEKSIIDNVLDQTCSWLKRYFAGNQPNPAELPLSLAGSPFQRAVWEVLLRIPYGSTATYGDIARRIGKPSASRAVGQAIGRNPVGIIIPCHRVVGANGKLSGFTGGIHNKIALLEHEGIDTCNFQLQN